MAKEPASSKKRQVKNPETFRERAIKASEEGDKPSSSSRFKTSTSKAAKPVIGPIGKFLSRVGRLKPVNFLGRIVVPSFIRSSWKELKLVKWPNLKQSRDLTFAVLVFAVIFGAIVAAVDFGLDKLFRNVLLK